MVQTLPLDSCLRRNDLALDKRDFLAGQAAEHLDLAVYFRPG